MTWNSTPLATGKGNGATTAVITAMNTSGAKLLVIETAGSGTPTVTETIGGSPVTNTWASGTFFNGTTPNTKFLYCILPTNVGANHVITVNGSVVSAVASAWTCTGTPQLDSQGTPNSTTNVQGQFSASSFTPASNGCLLLAGAAWAGATSGFGAGSGWTLIDAQPYVGGTSYGTSCAYKIQTTATAVPTTEGTVTWSSGSTNLCYNGIAFSEAASATITLTTPKAFEVHQRSGTTGSIQISGTYTGSPTSIRARFNGGSWAVIVASPTGGTFSGTLTGQTQGQGSLDVDFSNDGSVTASVANVGIGDIIVDIGDSRDEGRGTNGQAYSHATLKACMFKSGVWGELIESAGAGTMFPRLATQWMASQGVPVAFIRCGVGGHDVVGTHNEWAKASNADYTAMQTAVTNSTAQGIRIVLALFGPNAIVNGNNAAVALATARAAFDLLATNLAADLPGTPKLFMDICGEVGTGSPPDRRTAEDNIRGAVLSAWNNNGTAIKPSCVLIDQNYTDDVHPLTDPQLTQCADRAWPSIAEVLFSGSNGRGPRVSSMQWNSGRTALTVAFDRALKTGLTHATQAWIVNDVGGVGVMTISGIAYHGSNPNALVFTVSTPATGANGSTRVSFASGDDAVGRVIPLSTDITLPNASVVNLPAEPIYSYPVSEFAATATTVTVTLTTDGSTPAASLTGLRWAFFDQPLPNNFAAPVAKGSGASTNGSGVFSVSITGTALLVGAVGWLVVTDTDGTTTQTPMKGYSGPVVVS